MRFLRLGLVRQEVAGPDLAVRMRIGAAHDRPFVLEDLHPAVGPAQFLDLLRPRLDHGTIASSSISGSVRSCRGEKHITRHSPSTELSRSSRSISPEGGVCGSSAEKSLRKHERADVGRVDGLAGPPVSRAQVALRVVLRRLLVRHPFLLALPGPLRPVRRDQDPLAGQRVVTAVGMIGGVEQNAKLPFSRKGRIN